MTALDRLDWAAGFSATSFGVRLGVRVDDEALVPALRERLPPGARPIDADPVDHLYSVRAGGVVPGTRARRYYLVYGGATRIARTLDAHAALDAFESRARFDVAVSADPWVFVHAGAVGWRGRAIVLPAPSMHGKSRLVEALVRAGATYYSDEFAVLDAQGRVHPFAKLLGRRDDGGAVRRVSAAALGGETGVAPLPVGLVLATAYNPDAIWQPREMSAGEAVLELLGNTVRARLAPAHVLPVLAQSIAGAALWRGTRGEAAPAARRILDALDGGGMA